MSRIGKQPINLPGGVEVKIANDLIKIKGPKGELQQELHRDILLTQADGHLTVAVKDPEDKKQRSLWGLFQRLIDNMVKGVTEGFSKQLEINGVGYKVAASGANLNLNLGFSHPVVFALPKGIEAKVEKNIITISGADKQLVGQVAAEIRFLKKPEPYKGKGIKYVGEIVRRKAGKTATKAA
jgi:large subunit ribosomal protein L6